MNIVTAPQLRHYASETRAEKWGIFTLSSIRWSFYYKLQKENLLYRNK